VAKLVRRPHIFVGISTWKLVLDEGNRTTEYMGVNVNTGSSPVLTTNPPFLFFQSLFL